jgi:endonuclease/exonuclease/phosphatase family metal-dependent hydrolase
MRLIPRGVVSGFLLAVVCLLSPAAEAEIFRVATFNLQNYLDTPTQTRREPKSNAAKAKIRESLLAMKPDVIALQEIGTPSALQELQASLGRDGLHLPHFEHVRGFDTNIHVAVLSRFPIVARRSHTNDSFLLAGKRFRVSRGFAEVDIQVNDRYQFTLVTAHLKSKREMVSADEAEVRLAEAKILREKINDRLAVNLGANIIVLGDFNDTKNAPSTRTIIGRGRTKLVDTRPAERNGDNLPNPNPAFDPSNITWTHYYGVEDTYSRIDYIMVSTGMAREWATNQTYILAIPNWALASDHRPLVAAFEARDQ